MSWHKAEPCIRYWKARDGTRTYYVSVRQGEKRIDRKAGSTLAIARELRAKLQHELARGDIYPEVQKPKRIRLSAFIERYTEDYLKVKAAKSLRQEENRLKNVKKLLDGDPFLDEITAGDIESILAGMLREGRSPATYNRYRSRLNSLFRKAVAWEFLRDNPVEKVERMRERQLGDRYLHPHEFKKLLKACDLDMRPFVHIAALTGIRQGALLALRWEDIEPDLAFVTVRGETTKTGEPRRVPLNAEARGVLQERGPKMRGKLFPFDQWPRKQWDEIRDGLGWGKECEIPRLRSFRFHDLRHCCGSWLAMAGVPLLTTGKILGHKVLATTQRYAHLSDASLADAMEKIGPISGCNGAVTGIESETEPPQTRMEIDAEG